MTKIDLVESIHEATGHSKKEAAIIVDLFFDIMKDTLEKNDEVKISGFGNWSVRNKKSRMGRNPRTGDPVEITARRVLTFKASKILKDRINNEN
jgi:integration host factor subunit alpha